ncbi:MULTISPECIES: sensor histidine kinase NtrY-like [Pseudorhizobium]|uniref:sensor histidine kinase NtrY-like n=1 Tax=Pseudorhizobium TaxID=1903858 RepID=UPI000497099A|nr:PAS domain-containing sensor histidine kinase [Pseudorhizobium marinum]MBU1314910.1 PAS domain-containing sensor histidine kinase [Alphaproteobacteria bacterium]MBU1549992.1 PAS domain-containing sensor histidine kinase [Alphaproteobacteria bacterium]MBU2337206.1 PAS domain-containing sensor histidine kinase [Alphaproteobacteria bacterium]MBU2389537.1 PAS domain-containing sensor histidine kinase [Alphaproteobacteria bacterium]|tara:strand:+ start:7269 stop:9542 length:2274 start_codon:yes stop_codon:yes gene_type:complete
MIEGVVSPTAEAEPDGMVQDRRASFALPGLLLAGGALVCAILTLFVLVGLTPIAPTTRVVIASAVLNSIFVVGLMYLIGREVTRLFKARNRGRAAARLHIRVVVLFSIVAITPAVLVAIFASITLSAGLDRWFSIRTQSIVRSSTDVAQAYMIENASYVQGQTVSMANDLERNRAMFYLDRTGFVDMMTRQARGRGLLGAFLVREDGSAVAQADITTERPLPAIPQDALQKAAAGQPTLIPPGVTNLVGAIIKLEGIPGSFLYTIRAVDPKVMAAMRLMEDNTAEYQAMEAGRMSLQVAFAILYLGFALIVLLAAIWTAIAVADRIVRPIRLLISAADSVATGDLNVVVPVRTADGDVGNLSRTFNKMISEIRSQRDEILEAKDEVDDRRRFIEAVLSGVTAAVIGVEDDRHVTIVNSSAELFLGLPADKLIGRKLSEVVPEIDAVLSEAAARARNDFRKHVNLMRGGKERTLSVQVTREEQGSSRDSYVITLDDITDLVIAQRSTAWADVARRIAHEIKNPLTPIQLSAERLKRRYGKQIAEDDRAVFDQCTDTIVRQVGDIGRMVDEFSSFARMPKPAKEETDLRDIVRDAVFLREMGTSHVEFIRDLGDEPLIGQFDARMLGQAFGNLVKNAVEAIESVPSDQERDDRKVWVRARFDHSRDLFVVEIIDNGSGLPAENRHRILEPYMTMREKGTGLGLAIVKKIIEDHGGQLELHDAPAEFDQGRGAMIRVLLPQVMRTGGAGTETDKEFAYGV